MKAHLLPTYVNSSEGRVAAWNGADTTLNHRLPAQAQLLSYFRSSLKHCITVSEQLGRRSMTWSQSGSCWDLCLCLLCGSWVLLVISHFLRKEEPPGEQFYINRGGIWMMKLVSDDQLLIQFPDLKLQTQDLLQLVQLMVRSIGYVDRQIWV